MKSIGAILPQIRIPTLVKGDVVLFNLADLQGRWTIITRLPCWNLHEAVFFNQYQRAVGRTGTLLLGMLPLADPFLDSDVPKAKVLRVPLLSDSLGRLRRLFGIDRESFSSHKYHSFVIDPMRTIQYHLVHQSSCHGLSSVLEILEYLRAGRRFQVASLLDNRSAERLVTIFSEPRHKALRI